MHLFIIINQVMFKIKLEVPQIVFLFLVAKIYCVIV